MWAQLCLVNLSGGEASSKQGQEYPTDALSFIFEAEMPRRTPKNPTLKRPWPAARPDHLDIFDKAPPDRLSPPHLRRFW